MRLSVSLLPRSTVSAGPSSHLFIPQNATLLFTHNPTLHNPEMAKRFKLRLSLPSFQFCRSKQPSSLPQTPLPAATYIFSPVNSKSFDIAYPDFPDPPPSTPNHPLFKRHTSPKIVPVTRTGCRSTSCKQYKWVSDSDDDTWPVTVPRAEKKMKKKKKKKKKGKASVRTSTSSADGGWFSSEETESLVSSMSFDSSYDFGSSLETISEHRINGGGRKKSNNLKVRRLRRRYVSQMIPTPESMSPVRPCTVDEKVKESFAVVKRSEDPYEDFRRSMLEMILEKQMFEAKDLEQLLQCFLSLNSRHHHAVIVEAFSEIWEIMFCKSPKSQRV